MSGFIGGWVREKEDFAFLDSLPGEASVLAMRGAFTQFVSFPVRAQSVRRLPERSVFIASIHCSDANTMTPRVVDLSLSQW